MSSDGSALESLKIDRSRPAENSRFPWILILLLLGLAGAGFWWWKHRQPSPRLRTATVREVVAGTSASAGPQTLLNATGYVTARRAATVSSKVMGKVMEVLIEEGMSVEKDQILARLDDSNLQDGLRLAEAKVDAARKTMAELAPSLDFARKEAARFKDLPTNAVSQSDKARVESTVSEYEARIDRLAAEIKVAERQVDDWKQQVADMVIRAPFPGVITTKDAQPGEIISPMSSGGFTRTGIGTVVDMSSLEIEVDVNESYINRVQPGLPAQATLDAYADWRIPCKVIAIIPTADRQKATVKVRIGFDALDPRIFPEMAVKVAFQAAPAPAEKPDAAPPERILVIPTSAVQKTGDRSIVWVVRDGRVERRAIIVSGIQQDEATIGSGLNLGEAVVLNPPRDLADGEPVMVAQ